MDKDLEDFFNYVLEGTVSSEWVAQYDDTIQFLRKNRGFFGFNADLMDYAEQGIEKERISVAEKMIRCDKNFEEISEFTKLSVETLEELAKNLSND